mgnify:CR=1 FL=1
MRTQIHPTFYEDAVVTCVCGNSFTTGSVRKEPTTEICSACHPSFNGQQRIVDTGGQAARSNKRAATVAASSRARERARGPPRTPPGSPRHPAHPATGADCLRTAGGTQTE